jgi:hypothetical protein
VAVFHPGSGLQEIEALVELWDEYMPSFVVKANAERRRGGRLPVDQEDRAWRLSRCTYPTNQIVGVSVG